MNARGGARRFRLCGLLLLAAAGLGLPAAEKINLTRLDPVPATEPIPVSDFFRLPVLRNPAINSTGTHLAAIIAAGEDRSQLMIYDLAQKTVETLRGAGDKDINGFTWLDEQRLVAGLSGDKLYGLGLLTANVGALDKAYPLIQFSGVTLIGIPQNKPLQPLAWINWDMEDGRDRGVSVINTDLNSGPFTDLRRQRLDWSDLTDIATVRDSNERHLLKSYPLPPNGCTRYLTDKDGQLAFAITGTRYDALDLYQWTGEAWKLCRVDPDRFDIVDCGNKPGELVVRSLTPNGAPHPLQFMDAMTGYVGDVLLSDKGYDFQNGWLYRDPATREIVGAVYERSGPQTAWFSDDYRAVQKMVNAAFPGLVVRILGSDRASHLFLLMTFSDREPVTFHWFDLEKHTLGLVKKTCPWIDPARMQPMNVLKFKTRDGHQLDAYLTLPAGASKQNPAPLVVLSHGGPWQRDHWGYNGEVQFLASRGYAVLQTNYRGSLGYDWMFTETERNDFHKMHEDVTDATKTVLASGLVDPKRVAIMGGSFGGYLAMAGVVNEPELYRCAVTIAGVFDWEQFLQEKKSWQFEGRGYDFWKYKLGLTPNTPEKFAAIAPLRHIDRVRVPVLVAHGKEDAVVDIRQSRDLIAKLKQYGIPTEVVIESGEGHGMAHIDNQVELYTRIEAFLAKNLLPKK